MGGALYAAFDGRETIAQPSGEIARVAAPAPIASADDVVVKGDLPDLTAKAEPARQVIKVSTIAKDGERDVIRLKPFAKVSTTLIADMTEITDPIPPYNPLRIFADANAGTNPDAEARLYGAAVDSEMSVKVSDFPVDDPTLAPYLGEEGPHIRFSPALHAYSKAIVGDDKPLVEVDSVFCETATVRAGSAADGDQQ